MRAPNPVRTLRSDTIAPARRYRAGNPPAMARIQNKTAICDGTAPIAAHGAVSGGRRHAHARTPLLYSSEISRCVRTVLHPVPSAPYPVPHNRSGVLLHATRMPFNL